ncbi:unnamed protein product [Urochloa decumbens]|uniref:Dirigent protein n=1 Tax=Urochloa decumbens TaxID=240449 RepID=A0ABC9BM34_9POAL
MFQYDKVGRKRIACNNPTYSHMASYYAIVVLSVLAFSMSAGYALDCKKLQTTLYIKSYFKDNRAVGNDTYVIDWVIKDGPDAVAKNIGHAEGLVTHANLAKSSWVTIMDMVFEGGSLSGSSLKVMGLHSGMKDGPGQWSVIGGTGQLTMARGIINYKVIQKDRDSRTYQISIYVFYTQAETIMA